MKELKYIEKIRSEDSLLSMPQSLSQILSMVNSDDFSMDDLSKVIMKDTGLTSKVLKMANSAFYMQQSKISTVHQAVIMLGMMQVKCLALSASVFQTNVLEEKYDYNIKELFSHFISVALGCQMLAEGIEGVSSEEAFIAGLLHDIGLVYLIHHFPEDFKKVIDNAYKYPSFVEAEKDILEIDHAAIGRLLAEKWSFPPQLCDAIGRHHEMPQNIDDVKIVNIVQLSELINKPIIDDRPHSLERRLVAVNQLSHMMKIDRAKIEEISFSLMTETISMAEYMGIDIGEPAEILGRANKELCNSYITIENLFRERQNLSQRILIEERRLATMETKTIAIATLSHYINNAAMAISGRSQLIKMLIKNGVITDNNEKLDPIIDVVEKSVKKILAVLTELRDLTNLEELEKYSSSNAINIDDRVKERLQKMDQETTEVLTNPLSDR